MVICFINDPADRMELLISPQWGVPINRHKKMLFIINNNDFLMNGIHQARAGIIGRGCAR
jgi:hypothetical protein